MKKYDQRFRWENTSLFQGMRSTCRLRVYETQVGRVVILTELRENSGPSIANGLADLIPSLMKALQLEAFDEAVWLEESGIDVGPRFLRIQEMEDGSFNPDGPSSVYDAGMVAAMVEEPLNLLLARLP